MEIKKQENHVKPHNNVFFVNVKFLFYEHNNKKMHTCKWSCSSQNVIYNSGSSGYAANWNCIFCKNIFCNINLHFMA